MRPRPPRIEPGPGQESVWDYPRPPRVEPSARQVQVVCAGVTIANSRDALRVLETSSPPVYYLPPSDVRMDLLVLTADHTICEWKGLASYYALVIGDRQVPQVAWTYLSPNEEFRMLQRYLAFYPGRVDACFLDGERVRPQPGHFYGGWITDEIVGPFKGNPGSEGW